VPGGLGQLDELEAELDDGRGQLGEPRRERDADPVGIGGRVAESQRPTPRAAALQPRCESNLADEAVAPLWVRKGSVDEARQRALADLCHALLNANEFLFVD